MPMVDDEDAQVITSMELDGRALAFRHGVLVRSGAHVSAAWDIFLFDVCGESLARIDAEGDAEVVTGAGRRLAGRVRNRPRDRRPDYVRLASAAGAT